MKKPELNGTIKVIIADDHALFRAGVKTALSVKKDVELIAESNLWPFGISGDYPICLLRIHDGDSPLLIEALQAFLYWHTRHVPI